MPAVAGVPPPPPKLSGNIDQDFAGMVQYLFDFYRAAVLQGYFASQAGVDGVQSALQQQIDPASATAASAQTTANSALAIAQTNDTRLDTLEGQTLNTRLTAAEGSITTLEGQNLDTRLTAAEGDISTLQGNVTSLDGRLDALELDDAGTVTITGAATSAVGTIVTQPNTTYFVTATVVGTTGAPAAGAYIVTSVTKAVGQITIAVQAAPGVGNSVTFDWMVKR